MARFVTPDIGARISGGQISMGPTFRGAGRIALSVKPTGVSRLARVAVEKLEPDQAQVRIHDVDDGRLLGHDFGETAGRDDPRLDAHLRPQPRDDGLRLPGE